MSEARRINDDLTEKQIRGVDLVVKSAAKKYPFIKGWEFQDGWDRYFAHLYINLFALYLIHDSL